MTQNDASFERLLSKEWVEMSKENGYKLIEIIGYGSFGCVMKAQCIKTNQQYAIKLISEPFKNGYSARKLLREIRILRKYSEMESNIFTTHLHDIIVPSGTYVIQDGVKSKVDLNGFTHIFLVMDLIETDMKSLINNAP